MKNLLRQRALAKLFGNGLGGAAAASAVGYLADEVRKSLRKEPERLDVSQLRPGETYLVTTRPAMSRREAALWREATKQRRRADADAEPTRGARRTARKLERAQRRLDRTGEGSRREARRREAVRVLEADLARRSALSRRARRRVARADALDAALAAERERVVAAARSKARPPRTRRFT